VALKNLGEKIDSNNNIATSYMCEWILENQSKLHNKSYEINGFKDLNCYNLPREVSAYDNYTQYASIYYLSDHFQYLWLLLKLYI